jgi:hypothetical protein
LLISLVDEAEKSPEVEAEGWRELGGKRAMSAGI